MFKKVEKEQLKVPANVDYLGDLRDFVTQVGKRHRFSDKVINAFKLAIDEAATNIIRHAYRDREGFITLRAIVRKNSLTICIIDQGTYFDPKRVKEPDLNRYIDIGKKGGLGIFIMRKLMDDIDYRRTEEGNELRITKFRDKPEPKRLVERVSSIPLSIKATFFVRSVLIITTMVGLGYLYYYSRADDTILERFLATERTRNQQILNRINSAPGEAFEFVEDVVHPIYEEYSEDLFQMSVEDSTGTIQYSTNTGELLGPFRRPSEAEQVEPGVFRYVLNGTKVYEFESIIVPKEVGKPYGRLHVFVSAENTERQIRAIRLNELKFALVVLGISYLGVAILIYVLLNPLRKLSSWIKELGHGEIGDEIDIDDSSEIGEIAQAFSDITNKFRESQKNLADQERIQKEMQVAQDIQQTLLPMEFPEVEGYEIASYYEAAKEVGGDYYDFVEVDKDTLGIAIADVSGKGVPGSLVMTMIRTALRTEARGLKDAAEVLARVNAFVSNDIKKGMFVTVFYLIIDSKRRRINYASAGHNPMILYRASTKKTYYLNPKGFPIGIQLPEKDLFRKSIESETIQLTKDDILLIYTDGITEAMNPNRELFGEERLLQVLRDYGHLPANDFVEKLKQRIDSFTEGNPQYDDISFVAIKEKSTREEDELRRAKEAHRLISEGMSIREACETVNLTTYAYYNKYKRVFEEQGTEAFEIDDEVSVEAKYLSIEEKTKIFDIIAKHPEYGASRIADELNTEQYGFTKISESKIYEELVRNRLNTKQLREAFIERTRKSKRRLKPPGTPLLTLDGQIIIEEPDKAAAAPTSAPWPEPTRKPKPTEEPPELDAVAQQKESDSELHVTPEPPSEPPTEVTREGLQDREIEADALIGEPLDELLSKEEDDGFGVGESSTDFAPETDLEGDEPDEAADGVTTEEIQLDLAHAANDEIQGDTLSAQEFSFEDLFADTSMLDTQDEEDDETFEREGEEPDENGIGRYEGTLLNADDAASPVEILQQDVEPEEPEHPQPVPDEVDGAEFTTASVDELLSVTADDDLEEEDGESDQDAEVPTPAAESPPAEEAPVVTSRFDDDQHSFADLIQAIDEQIVYVRDQVGKKEMQSKEEPTAAVSVTQTAPAQQKSIEPHELDERERQLIKGIRFYKNKEYDEAIREFKKVIEKYPDYKEAHSILGNAYFRNKMYDEASLAYERVKQLDAQDVTAYENMGVIYANRGQYELAVSEWKRVLELNPERRDIEEKIRKAMAMI